MSTSILTSPRRLVALLLAFFALTGCFTTTTLVNPMEMPLNDSYTIEQIDSAMQKAGVDLKWVLTKNDKGFLGTLKVRDHEVVVQFNRSIALIAAEYKSSTNLDYDGTHIHKKYHMWVDHFFKAVRKNLQTIQVEVKKS